MNEGKRLRIVPVAGELLVEMMKPGDRGWRCTSGLPQDARLSRMGYDETGAIYLVVESAEYGLLSEASAVPRERLPVFEWVEDGARA